MAEMKAKREISSTRREDMNTFGSLMLAEYRRAREKLGFDDFHSGHEGIGVIREEYLELEKFVHTKDYTEADMANAKKECVQLAAMAMAFWLELFDH
jgi:hypothetical protein